VWLFHTNPDRSLRTTGVAALLAGKRFIGIERDKMYFDYAFKRIERAWKSVGDIGETAA
jgi:site-specific DNA-methyltransferase (adenine-specific)